MKENETESKEELMKEQSNNKNNTLEEMTELMNEEKGEKEHRGNSFIKNIVANILDQGILLAGSALILLLFDRLIRVIGYMVAMQVGVLLIIYFIVNCIYEPIIKKTRFKNTIARKILNIN